MKNSPNYNRFIRLGRFGTPKQREEIVTYLQSILHEAESKAPSFALHQALLKPLYEQPELAQAAQEFPHLLPQWHQETIAYLNTSQLNLTKATGELSDEKVLLEHLQGQKAKTLMSAWKKGHPAYDFLSKQYNKKSLDPAFYQQQFQELAKANKERIVITQHLQQTGKGVKSLPNKEHDGLKLEAIKEKLQSTWSTLLHEKTQMVERDKAQKLCQAMIAERLAKVEQYRKLQDLLGFFIEDFGRLWNLANGSWQAQEMEALLQHAGLLEQEGPIRELAQLLGRIRKQETRWEYEQLQIIKTVLKPTINPAGKADLVGVNESQDLSQVLPCELALFGEGDTETVFFKKYSEHKLQTYQLQSKELEAVTITTIEEQKVAKIEAPGPFIVCVDTSGSMHGAPERWAKAITLAILKIALNQNRQAFLISFSTQIQTLPLSELPKSLPRLVKFLQHSFHGGTDAAPAFKAACQQLQKQEYQKADVLMISDGVMPEPDEEILAMIEAQKVKSTRFYALLVQHQTPPTPLPYWDKQWHVDLGDEQDSVRRIVEELSTSLDRNSSGR